MQIQTIFSTALLLLVGLENVSAKALIHISRNTRRNDMLEDELGDRTMEKVESRITRRQPQSSSAASPSQLTPIDLDATLNATISSACLSALSSVTKVNNAAGMTACYNILQIGGGKNTFQADLRLYRAGQASDDFASIPLSNLMIGLTFPPSTRFQSLVKRSSNKLVTRQSQMTEIQQYSLFGGFLPSTDVTKLNSTQIMSLMVPTITINAVQSTSQNVLSTNLTESDVAYFVMGEFKDQFSSSAISSDNQAAAVMAASPFVLPGTALAFFPTGLVITLVWVLIFVTAFGVGTLGRIRHRTVFRQRLAATAGRPGRRRI